MVFSTDGSRSVAAVQAHIKFQLTAANFNCYTVCIQCLCLHVCVVMENDALNVVELIV
jgi:hypothetical protein